MHSRLLDDAWPLRRHDLVFIDPKRPSSEPVVAGWCENGWPLITRRPTPCEPTGIALGLPLPPSQGKKRFSLVVQRDEILAVHSPLSLTSVRDRAPREWLSTIGEIEQLAHTHNLDVRVFGSLGWSVLTGLDYLTAKSDLDLLFHVTANTDLDHVIRALARIEATAPMRLDGEFVREDGGAANWREFLGTGRDVMVKSLGGAGFVDRQRFLRGDVAI